MVNSKFNNKKTHIMKLWSTSCNVYMYCSHDTIFHVFKGDLVDVFGRCKFYIRIVLYKLKNNTNCTFNSTFNTYNLLFQLIQNHLQIVFTLLYITIIIPLFHKFWSILDKQNQWSKFSYSFKKHYSLNYIHIPHQFSIALFTQNWTYQNICSL